MQAVYAGPKGRRRVNKPFAGLGGHSVKQIRRSLSTSPRPFAHTTRMRQTLIPIPADVRAMCVFALCPVRGGSHTSLFASLVQTAKSIRVYRARRSSITCVCVSLSIHNMDSICSKCRIFWRFTFYFHTSWPSEQFLSLSLFKRRRTNKSRQTMPVKRADNARTGT